MALPTILVNSATGSDTQASGAGPSTALFGTTNASTDGTGLIVTLPAGTVLTGVSTTGSDVIFLNAGSGRYFGKITNTAGSGGATPTVTVADAFATGLSSKSWAIGGKRASLWATTTSRLLENGGSTGDAKSGWVVELQSGHTENITGLIVWRSTTDANGPITVRGESGAATMPVLTSVDNGISLIMLNVGQRIQDLEVRNSNATKTASTFIRADTAVEINGLKIAHATNYFWRPIHINGSGVSVIRCNIGYSASYPIYMNNGAGPKVLFNFIHDGANKGIYSDATLNIGTVIYGNIVYNCVGNGIEFTLDNDLSRGMIVAHNTIDTCTGDGVKCASASTSQSWAELTLLNNLVSNCGGYGFNFSALTTVAEFNWRLGPTGGNATYNNTSGATNPSGFLVSDPGLNPTYGGASSGDFSLGTNLKAKAFPLGGSQYVGGSTTYSYADPGASQRQEPSSAVNILVQLPAA